MIATHYLFFSNSEAPKITACNWFSLPAALPVPQVLVRVLITHGVFHMLHLGLFKANLEANNIQDNMLVRSQNNQIGGQQPLREKAG